MGGLGHGVHGRVGSEGLVVQQPRRYVLQRDVVTLGAAWPHHVLLQARLFSVQEAQKAGSAARARRVHT